MGFSAALLMLSVICIIIIPPASSGRLPNGTIGVNPPLPPTFGRVPGSSPFHYIREPAHNLLQIDQINTSPSPFKLGDHWTLNANGYTTRDLGAIQLKITIKGYSHDGPMGELPFEDDLCNWAVVIQGGQEQCPPKKGPVTISYSRDLPSWQIEEANYTLEIHVTTGLRRVTHIIGAWELKDRRASEIREPSTVIRQNLSVTS